jgi:hypothetical protein
MRKLGSPRPHEATRAPSRPPTSQPSPLERVITEAEPQTAKALLRLLIEELRVNGRREIQPTYRLVRPAVRAMSEEWAEPDIPQTFGERQR